MCSKLHIGYPKRLAMQDALLLSIKSLISNTIANCSIREINRPSSTNGEEGRRKSIGSKRSGTSMQIWFPHNADQTCVLEVQGKSVPLTKKELRFIMFIAESLRTYLVSSPADKWWQDQKDICGAALQSVVISRFLVGSFSKGTYVTSLSIRLLQELAFHSYEGRPVTSGIILLNHADKYIRALKGKEGVAFFAFEENIIISEQLFSDSIGYRFVDGKSKFFVIDNIGRVLGVIAIPPDHNIPIPANDHLRQILAIPAGRRWIARIGDNRDIYAYVSDRVSLYWSRMRWQLLDTDRLKAVISQSGLVREYHETFLQLLMHLSSKRLGSLILVSAKNGVGSFARANDSQIASELSSITEGTSLDDVFSDSVVDPIFNSDGLVTINCSGEIVGAHQIIPITGDDIEKNPSAGGRTIAGISASRYGMVFKISADGPITVFNEGEVYFTF